MAVSSAVAAGIGVGCSAFTFVISFPIVLWIRRWFLRGLDPDPPDPYYEEKKRRECSRMILEAMQDHQQWSTMTEDFIHFASRISAFVMWYAEGTGQDTNFPLDPEKLHRLAGGSLENWANITNLDKEHRCHALAHLICRVMYQRMIPTGDCSITLLPANMLQTYQQMLTKLPIPGPMTENEKERQRTLTMLRQHWRAMTAFFISEDERDLKEFEEQGTRKPNALVRRYPNDCKMTDDDPRMPNILAVEALLRDALDPFWKKALRAEIDDDLRFESTGAKTKLREITASAANIALKAFSQIEPIEFYWPLTDRCDGPDPYGNGGYLHCFGVRQRQPCPGNESDQYKQVVTTANLVPPLYNDTPRLLWSLFYADSHANSVKDAQELQRRKKANNGEETEDDRKRREWLEDRNAKMEEYLDWHMSFPAKTDGWDGATDFF
ncbi:hypothetical protein CC79DRAFT_1364273 [Sarocladium strictum]